MIVKINGFDHKSVVTFTFEPIEYYIRGWLDEHGLIDSQMTNPNHYRIIL